MITRPLIPLGGTMKVVDMKTGRAEEKPSGMMMLPPAPGKCPECAADHAPEQPHNAQSLFYQMKFHGEHGRWPTWTDALAHCAEPVRKAWAEELRKRGAWEEPEPTKPRPREAIVPAGALIQPGTVINVQDGQGGPDRPGRILAVVPKGVAVEIAIAEQNGQPRPNTYTINRSRGTLYVIEVTNPDGTTERTTVREAAMRKGLTNAAPREGA